MAVYCVFFKEMKMLDKEVRVWDVYTGLESIVKNLLTSLRAVNELQNSAVRERHWQQLMNTTGVWGKFGCFTVSQNLLKRTRSHILPRMRYCIYHSIDFFLLLCNLMFFHLTILPSHVQACNNRSKSVNPITSM